MTHTSDGKYPLGRILLFAFLLTYALFCLSPLVLALINSFKTRSEIFTNIIAFPQQLEFANYGRSIKSMRYFRSLLNSSFIATAGLFGIIIFSSIAGWALCRFKGKLSTVIFSLFVISMLIPFNAIMIPLYRIATLLHLSNSLWGMGWIYSGLGVGMAVFMYHGFVKGIPVDLEDASRIDGCNLLMTFRHVVFPLLFPITATIGIMNLLWMWNDFLLPLIMLQSPSRYTLLLSTNMLFGKYASDWPAILSALILSALPMVIVYILLQKHIIKGITEGALKG
jgi:raffinose/stachyose/melibiose transport system permease protein